MKDMKLNILGTEYDYRETTSREDPYLCSKDGYCDSFAKIITIEVGHNWSGPDTVKDHEALYRKIRRHEVIHAFFCESGLDEYSDNELLVDWLAVQFPKLMKAFEEVGAL